MTEHAELLRVRGLVQGVGFRPAVWRLAHRLGLRGWVANDGDGVAIKLSGPAVSIDRFVAGLRADPPKLARIDRIERVPGVPSPDDTGFRITGSISTRPRTGIVPDAATCPECLADVLDAAGRRYRYPFTNCTHCGPRLSIIEAIPYDRRATTMRMFPMCAACTAEYRDPADRRFHAQPIACDACGPRAWLEAAGGRPATLVDPADTAALLLRGDIVAIKGVGGFQLACDATNPDAVARLRDRKHRPGKPLALMARDIEVARTYCALTDQDVALLQSPAAPIVIATAGRGVAANVAPGIATLGIMLPNTPLHHLLLQRIDRPIVLTSGNLSDEPQCIDNADARDRLGQIADFFLMHDRDIARRVDDSIVRVMAGEPRILRRARGYAPAPIPLPDGFADAPPILAMGGELKVAFCLLADGQAILSHHMGDLENPRTFADYVQSIDAYQTLFQQKPDIVAVDCHPDYLSTKLGRGRGANVVEVQHHHAHIAACLADNHVPISAQPVIGIALDGLGMGLDGTLWGGEFLLADYRSFQRLGTLKPVALPGGSRAVREPWRNTYAHLMAAMGWPRFAKDYGGTELYAFLAEKPRATLDGMIAAWVNSPRASSCGRLFDAVAAAAGICRDRNEYEGQAAAEFEALVDQVALTHADGCLAYPFAITRLQPGNLPCIEPAPMWQALLDDLIMDTPVPVIAARFHKGLAAAIVRMVDAIRGSVTTVVLSGGVLQNRVLLELLTGRLVAGGMRVLTHTQVPANDGGLALGQAVIAAARFLQEGSQPCA